MQSGGLAKDTGCMRFASSAHSTNKGQPGIFQTSSTSIFYASQILSIFLFSKISELKDPLSQPMFPLPGATFFFLTARIKRFEDVKTMENLIRRFFALFPSGLN